MTRSSRPDVRRASLGGTCQGMDLSCVAPHVAERARAALGVPDGADSLVILALGSLVSSFRCLCGAGTAIGPQCAASLSRFHRVRTAVRARSWIPDKAQFRWGAPLAGDTEGSSARTPASKCIMVRTDLPVPPGALASTANAAGGGAFYELLSNACSLPPVRSQRAVSPQ